MSRSYEMHVNLPGMVPDMQVSPTEVEHLMAPNQTDALQALSVLVGTWQAAAPGVEAAGETTFEWLPGGGFLVQRATVDRPEFPNSISVIGATGANGGLQQHYFDSRGVARVYEMTLEDRTWTISREGPDWPQRYVGRISDDGSTITGRWERGVALGAPLELDFELNFTRLG